MIDSLIQFDKWLFVLINGLHSPIVDPVMIFFSKKVVWAPLYIFIAFWLFVEVKKNNLGKIELVKRETLYSLLFFTGVMLTFLFTDSAANFIKDTFERLRPCHDETLAGVCRLLEGKGGLYGFVSNHASNVFGLALFTSLTFKNRKYTILIFIWAAIVSYSRIYVGKHFPADVFFGALLGLTISYLTFKIISYIYKNKRR